MTPKQKELLIQDLCARLPYGVRGRDNEFDNKEESCIVIGITKSVDNEDYLVQYEDTNPAYLDADNFKPILFPLEAIKEELNIDGNNVCVRNVINSHLSCFIYIDNEGDIDIERADVSFVYLEEYRFIIDIFNRYHIDYRGLIDKGLAISVFDLPENPYK